MESISQIINRTLGPRRVDGPRCAGCVQEFVGERFIPWDGTGQNGVLLLADSPWKTEVEKGYVLAGASGQILERVFNALGVRRQSFLLANGSIWCKPPQLGWSDHPEQYPDAALAIAHCRPYLDELIEKTRPKAIVALGGAALRRMTGTNDIGSFQCYVLDSSYGIPVIPTYHPSYLCRPSNKKLMFSLVCAVRKALDIAAGVAPAAVKDELLLDPPLDEARAYLERGLVDGRFPELYVDIETPRAVSANGKSGDDSIDYEDRRFDTTGEMGASYQLLRVGLAHSRYSALTMPWQPPYIDLIKWALGRCDLFIEHAHNNYDSRRLKANGCAIGKVQASSMWCWHFYQSDLDKALEFAAPFFSNTPPWKHLGDINPTLYNALDVARGYDVWFGSKQALQVEGRWDAFWRECVEFGGLLKQVELKGVCVDADGKTALMSELDAEIKEEESKLLTAVPASAKKVTIKQRKPKDADGYVEVTLPVTKRKRKKGWKGCPLCATNGGRNQEGKLHDCYFDSITEDKSVWRKEEFNSGSSKQVKGLLKELGINVPKKRGDDGEYKETTGKKQLQRIAKKDARVRPILIIRSKSKLRDAYDWNIDDDGRIRTFYGFNPSTWRLSSWYPNLQVIPNRGEMAPRVRRLIKASKGNILGEVDSSAIEAVLVGYYAKSERFIRLAKAGVHGWLTAAWMKQPISLDLPFDELQRQCKAIKRLNPKLYNTIKPIVHGSNYDESAWGIYEQNPEEFDSPEQAAQLRSFYLSTEPGRDLVKWQSDTRQQAHSQRFLQTVFGVKHWFWSVFAYNQWKEVWEPDAGGDGKRCLGFLPQSSAASIQRFYALYLRDKHPELIPFLRLFTHDSKTIEYPESLGDEPVRVLASVMSQPIPQLGGLAIGVEAKVGDSLGTMDEVKL